MYGRLRGLTMPVALVLMATSAAMLIGGNTALLAESPDEAQLNKTQTQGLLGENGNLEEYDRETDIDETPRSLRNTVMKLIFQYTIWVADAYAMFVYHTSLPLLVYQGLAAIPVLSVYGMVGLQLYQLLQGVRR